MGKLIVIDGLDGSGKATQAQILFDELKKTNENIIKLSFPNYDDDSSQLIKIYLRGELGDTPDAVNAFAASSFYAVDRYVSYKKYWEEKYLGNYTIICDRYATSNLIHQMSKLDKTLWDDFINWANEYEYERLGLPKPDKVIYLDMDVDISQKLISSRCEDKQIKKDIHEKDVLYLKKCRDAAHYVAKVDDWIMVDTCDDKGEIYSKEEIGKQIFEIIMD